MSNRIILCQPAYFGLLPQTISLVYCLKFTLVYCLKLDRRWYAALEQRTNQADTSNGEKKWQQIMMVIIERCFDEGQRKMLWWWNETWNVGERPPQIKLFSFRRRSPQRYLYNYFSENSFGTVSWNFQIWKRISQLLIRKSFQFSACASYVHTISSRIRWSWYRGRTGYETWNLCTWYQH